MQYDKSYTLNFFITTVGATFDPKFPFPCRYFIPYRKHSANKEDVLPRIIGHITKGPRNASWTSPCPGRIA